MLIPLLVVAGTGVVLLAALAWGRRARVRPALRA